MLSNDTQIMGPWCAGIQEGLNLLIYLKKYEEPTFKAFSGLVQVWAYLIVKSRNWMCSTEVAGRFLSQS